MASLLVNFGLRHDDVFDYGPLMAELGRIGGTRVLLSTWILRSSSTDEQVADHLQKFMHPDDGIVVVTFERIVFERTMADDQLAGREF